MNSQYKPVIKNTPVVSLANPYKREKEKDAWTKICEKYNEKDRSKLTKEDREGKQND